VGAGQLWGVGGIEEGIEEDHGATHIVGPLKDLGPSGGNEQGFRGWTLKDHNVGCGGNLGDASMPKMLG
jgi:hypothetical protein